MMKGNLIHADDFTESRGRDSSPSPFWTGTGDQGKHLDQ